MIATEYRLPIYALIFVLYLLAMYRVFLAMRRRESMKRWEEHNARAESMHQRDAQDAARAAADA